MRDALKVAVSGQSKTINSNVIAGPLSVILVWAAGALGVQMPPEVAAAFVALIMGALNVGLRFLTTTALADKARSE